MLLQLESDSTGTATLIPAGLTVHVSIPLLYTCVPQSQTRMSPHPTIELGYDSSSSTKQCEPWDSGKKLLRVAGSLSCRNEGQSVETGMRGLPDPDPITFPHSSQSQRFPTSPELADGGNRKHLVPSRQGSEKWHEKIKQMQDQRHKQHSGDAKEENTTRWWGTKTWAWPFCKYHMRYVWFPVPRHETASQIH